MRTGSVSHASQFLLLTSGNIIIFILIVVIGLFSNRVINYGLLVLSFIDGLFIIIVIINFVK